MLSIQYQKKHMKYSVLWKQCHLGYRWVFPVFFLSSLKGATKPWMTNWFAANDMSILVSETLRISMFPKTASDKSSILFLIEFMLIWLIMTLFIFFILNFFNVSLKLSSTDWQVIKSDPLTFPHRLWEICHVGLLWLSKLFVYWYLLTVYAILPCAVAGAWLYYVCLSFYDVLYMCYYVL